MRIFIAALTLVALCVIGLCFNIIFRKGGRFPDTEIENNEDMKRLGIKCVKAEEMERCRKTRGGCASCAGCSLYKKEEEKKK